MSHKLKIIRCPICSGDAYDIEVQLWGCCDACKHEIELSERFWDNFDPFTRAFKRKEVE